MTAMERFHRMVSQEPNTGCWLWTGSRHRGYGKFWDGQKMVLAYRYAYQHLVGPIPNGLTIDHLCRVPACVNPAHLEPVTMRSCLICEQARQRRRYYRNQDKARTLLAASGAKEV